MAQHANDEIELASDELDEDEQRAAAAAREIARHLDNPTVSFEDVEKWHAARESDVPTDANDERSRFIGPAGSHGLAAAALQHLAGDLWTALSALEPHAGARPTWWLDGAIRMRENAMAWLEYVYTTCGTDDAIEVDGVQVSLITATHGLGLVAHNELHRLRMIREQRIEERAALEAASPASTRGARGMLAGPERLRTFLGRVAPLEAAGWKRPQLAELVIDSSTWRRPPCAAYVEDLLDAVDHVRGDAISRLTERMRESSRQSGGTRRSSRNARKARD